MGGGVDPDYAAALRAGSASTAGAWACFFAVAGAWLAAEELAFRRGPPEVSLQGAAAWAAAVWLVAVVGGGGAPAGVQTHSRPA